VITCLLRILPVSPSAASPRNRTNPHRTPAVSPRRRRLGKKIRGKLHFGKWDDPDRALKKDLAEKDALHAGREPRENVEGLTVKELCNTFLNAKQALVDSGELPRRSRDDYVDRRNG